MSVVTIAISVLALLISGITLFLQFFHRPRRLRVITMPMGRDGRARFGICNAGKECVYITGLAVNYSSPLPQGGTKEYTVGDVRGSTSIVNPGKIVEFSYSAKDPPNAFLEGAFESLSPSGEHEKTVDIVVFIQFAFPDGKIFSNFFKAGSYSVGNNTKSQGIYGVNLDLLKSALPVLDKD